MDLIRKIPKKFGNKVINRQYFHRKTGLQTTTGIVVRLHYNAEKTYLSLRNQGNYRVSL